MNMKNIMLPFERSIDWIQWMDLSSGKNRRGRNPKLYYGEINLHVLADNSASSKQSDLTCLALPDLHDWISSYFIKVHWNRFAFYQHKWWIISNLHFMMSGVGITVSTFTLSAVWGVSVDSRTWQYSLLSSSESIQRLNSKDGLKFEALWPATAI